MNYFSKIKNHFKWTEGRQGSGYFKFRLIEFIKPISFDIYILKFPENSSIPIHIDPVKKGFSHYRLNIILKRSKEGGDFLSEKNIINTKRIKYFRPDISKHSVSKVISGTRFVLSIGFLIKEKGE